MDLQTLLPLLVPKAIAWAQEQSHLILRSGVSLNEKGTALATHVGVAKPALVRIQYVSELPMPEDPLLLKSPMLRKVADATGLIGPHMAGITLGYSIFIVERHADVRLISHELRDVQQYESFGGIEAFMPIYLAQIATVGYYDAPLEQDARAHEVHANLAIDAHVLSTGVRSPTVHRSLLLLCDLLRGSCEHCRYGVGLRQEQACGAADPSKFSFA